jgi:hypothetical protein
MKRHQLLARCEFDRFLGSLQQLQVAKDLIESEEPEKARMAIILLHSLADGLMFSAAIDAFETDLYFAKILPAKYSATDRKKVLRYFDEKVEFCQKKIKLLSVTDTSIFKIVNFYRNAAYHRDTHNPRVILPIARIAFHSILRLFRRGVIKSDGFIHTSAEGLTKAQSDAIKAFCKVDGLIDYDKASKEAIQRLKKGVSVRLRQVQSAFLDDLRARLARIKRMGKETLYCKNRRKLDGLLKMAAFELKGIDENLFAEMRQLRYRLLAKVPGGKPSREEYVGAEKRYAKRVKRAFKSFTPDITTATIDHIEHSILSLQMATSLGGTLSVYLAIDKLLVEVEVLALHAERRIDEAIQARIDLEKGK